MGDLQFSTNLRQYIECYSGGGRIFPVLNEIGRQGIKEVKKTLLLQRV
jgi:hypothetical protein